MEIKREGIPHQYSRLDGHQELDQRLSPCIQMLYHTESVTWEGRMTRRDIVIIIGRILSVGYN
ncbi:hypothetical protein BDV32DRAFT_128490 [Aspergillus pseudonomiae]|nr:hypothetical protein BDV32DRAFT_128490 [Aspergillus pseudonomiae]